MTAIEVQRLTKYYGQKAAVKDLHLTIRQGELFSLLGINGAGKSTTIKMLSCLLRPDTGDALLLGDSILTSPAAVKEKISISPQETAVAPNLSVRENLELMAGIYRMRDRRNRVESMLVELGLEQVAGNRAKTLSGGWQRRLSIAMALITGPQILFLDEPTLGLDVLARRELWAVIRSLRNRATVILTTHYLEEAEALSSRVGIMANGQLQAVGTPAELKALARVDNFEDAFILLSSGKEVA